MIDQDAIPLSQLQEKATALLDALIRDWASTSWMFPDRGSPHPIEALSRALTVAAGDAGSLNAEFIRGDYTAQIEKKLQAWESAAAKAIARWEPQRIAELIALFPKCVPSKYTTAAIEVRHSRDGWYCCFPQVAPPAPAVEPAL